MLALILPLALLTWMAVWLRQCSWRVAFLQSLVTCATITVLVTEALSAWQAIDRTGLLLCWVAAAVLPLFWLRPVRLPMPARPSLFVLGCIGVITGMAGIIAVTAFLSPPNSSDALSYHLPRVIYWMQQRSVAFFPTQYLNQIMLQPVTEYVMLHAYVLAGSDRLTNLVQFAGYVGCVVGVSTIAARLGLPVRAQAIAAVLCATLPDAILQASGAKNDLVLALWLVCAVLFLLRWMQDRRRVHLLFLALSVGLALGTKGTAYLFLPPALGAVALASGVPLRWKEWGVAAAATGAGVLLINGPQYARNYDLSGSVMGFDSAQGDGFFRWRNEPLGWKPVLSNLLRNTSEQLGARSEGWNQRVYDAVLKLHRAAGIDPQDPGTTWRWSEFKPPRNTNHEADANNRWHLLLFVIAGFMAMYFAARRGDRRWLFYALGPAGGFLAFCFYLKWQPFFSRLETPLFVLCAPLGAMAIAKLRPVTLQILVCLLLISNTRLALLQNWTRPLTGAGNLRNTPRRLLYFNDMAQWNNRDSYLEAVDAVARSGCLRVGIDTAVNHVEYPFQALLRERNPAVRFEHTGVENASAKYGPAGAGAPCAILCLDCAGVEQKMALYGAGGDVRQIGRFLLVIRPSGEGRAAPL